MAAKTEKPENLKLVRLALSEADHRKLRMLAARAGLPMSQYVHALVLEKIKLEK